MYPRTNPSGVIPFLAPIWLKCMFARLVQYFNSLDTHIKDVINAASMSLLLKAGGAVLSFTLSVVLARLLGAEGAGQYFLAFSVVTVGAVLGRAGLDNAVVRLVAANADSDNWSAVKGVYFKSLVTVSVAASFVALITLFASPWIASSLFDDPGIAQPLAWMAFAILPVALYTLFSQLLQGVERVRESIVVLNVLPPLLILAAVAFTVPEWGVIGATVTFALAAVLTLGVAWWLWGRAVPQLKGVEGVFPTRQLFDSCAPLFWVSLAQIVITYAPTVFLGAWAESADVGIFSAASRVVMLVAFVFAALNAITSPKFAAFYARGDLKGLERLARQTTKLLLVSAGPVVMVLWFFPEYILGIFGPEFVGGAQVISILAIGQFINIVTGPAGNVLIMCGYERLVRNSMIVSAITVVTLCYVLIPLYGILGAALASSIVVAVENLIMVGLLWHKLGVVTIPLVPSRGGR